MYYRTGGKSGKHAWIDKVQTIASISNIVVQLYTAKSISSAQWSPILKSRLETVTYAVITRNSILYAFAGSRDWKYGQYKQLLMPPSGQKTFLDCISGADEAVAVLQTLK
jgi:hypothetical protein